MSRKFLTCLTILFCVSGFAQDLLFRNSRDPLFTNTQQALIYLNPSFAGSNGLLRSQSLYRFPTNNQAFSSATLYNGVDVYVKPLKGGLAVTHVFDNYGEGKLKTNTIALSYARHFSFLDNKLKIMPSLQVAYLQKDLDKTKLTFDDYYWWGEGISSNKRNIDFSSGLLINYKNFYFGTSVFHMSQPNEGLLGDSRLHARFSFHSSYNHQLNKWASSNIFAQYQIQSKYNFGQVKINFLFVDHFIFGMSYFSNNAASINLGYKNNYFTLGLGYDQRLTNLQQQLNSALEAQFSLNIRDKEHRKSPTSFEAW